MLSCTPSLSFSYSAIIYIHHPYYHPKIKGHILKDRQESRCVFIHEIIHLIIMKIKMKMKNRPYRYDKNRPRSRPEHKCSKYEMCLSIIIVICIK